MQILLNLLPEEQKVALRRRFYFRFFTWQTTLFALIIIFYLLLLVGVYSILNSQTKAKEESYAGLLQANSEAKKITEYQANFKEANSEAALVGRLSKNHLHWSNFLHLLDTLTPTGIVWVDLSTKDYTVSLDGQAHTRENFLAFQDNLKGESCVTDVKTPISNLFSEKDFDFQIEFTVKRACLLDMKP